MPRIWGARSLAPIYPHQANLSEPIGEAWLTGPECEIATGPLQGALSSAWQKMPPGWRGTDFTAQPNTSGFPLLIKFIFPADQLSIQVHPGDAYARENEAPNALGKTEMWHAVSAEPGSTLLLGFKPGVDRAKLLQAIETSKLEDLFQRWLVCPGDTFYVPAGIPHTIGAGVVLCEVQQNSDLTYRLYDFNRVDARRKPRELHIEKSLAVIDFSEKTGGKLAPVALPSSHGAKKSLLVACPYFASERWDISAENRANSDPARFELLVILKGDGKLRSADESYSYRQGECWFVPAQLGQFSLQPGQATSILRTYVPNIGQMRADLSRSGAQESAVEKVFFS